MTKQEANKIIERFSTNDNCNEIDEFVFIEACNFLIETENDSNASCLLAGFYYEKEKYNLAEKYYLLADEFGDEYASCGLGFIYYYGRNGAKDFKKAFHYYQKSMGFGNMESAMKIADMYHNGYGVDKDDAKYKELLVDIFEKIKDSDDLFSPYPEVAHRLADIYIKEGHVEDCIEMLVKGKSFIAQRIRYNPFWGNFIVCRRLISILYSVIEFDETSFDFFDLFYLLEKEHEVFLTYHGKTHIITSFFDEGQMRVKCDNDLYKSTEDFLIKAKFENKHVYIIDYDGEYYSLKLNK